MKLIKKRKKLIKRRKFKNMTPQKIIDFEKEFNSEHKQRLFNFYEDEILSSSLGKDGVGINTKNVELFP